MAKVNKKSMSIEHETDIQNGAILNLTLQDGVLYFSTSFGTILTIADTEYEFNKVQTISCSHNNEVSQISFPHDFSEIFATSSEQEFRVWNLAS